MAEKIMLVDDINGATDDDVKRRHFEYGGDQFEIDLLEESWKGLMATKETMESYVAHARLVTPKHSRRQTSLSQLSEIEKKMIRADLGRGPRGTIPDEVVDAWVRERELAVAEENLAGPPKGRKRS